MHLLTQQKAMLDQCGVIVQTTERSGWSALRKMFAPLMVPVLMKCKDMNWKQAFMSIRGCCYHVYLENMVAGNSVLLLWDYSKWALRIKTAGGVLPQVSVRLQITIQESYNESYIHEFEGISDAKHCSIWYYMEGCWCSGKLSWCHFSFNQVISQQMYLSIDLSKQSGDLWYISQASKLDGEGKKIVRGPPATQVWRTTSLQEHQAPAGGLHQGLPYAWSWHCAKWNCLVKQQWAYPNYTTTI